MLSPKRISWLLIAICATSMTFVLANKYSTGQASLVRQPVRMKVLRRKEHAALKPSLKEIQDEHSPLKERVLEDEIPKHLPIKIKVKKEKEFKDLNNDNWARDFELEITNTGDKPIYFLYLLLRTGIKAKAGYNIAFTLYFGRTELGDIRVKALPDDVSIKPGESYNLKIHSGSREAWEVMNRKENRPQPQKLQVIFQKLHFGDGTGYGPGGIRLPSEWKDRPGISQCVAPLSSGGGHSPGELRDWLASDWPTKNLKHSLPAATLPVNFFAASGLSFLTNASLQTCCTGDGCTTLISQTMDVCVNCPPRERPSITFCGDPQAVCYSSDFSESEECFLGNGQPYAC